MDRFTYYLAYIAIQIVSRLPFSVLYLVSDVFYFLCYYVAHYRRKTVYSNLKTSFPEKSEEERKKIEKEFYHWFCDVLLESVKAFGMTVEELNEHMKYENMELMRKYVNEGRSIFMDMAHTGSWEWVPNIYLTHFSDIVGAELYRHVKNKYLDEYLLKVRQRFETLVIPKDQAIRPLVKIRKENKIFALGLLADQTPSRSNIHFWTDFLHHDTPFLQGPERLAKMFKAAVVYLDFRCDKRGYYVCTFRDITEDASKTEDGYVTRKYAELLEESIQKRPAIWFWTHRRWKYDHQAILKEEAEKQSQKQQNV